MSVPRKIWVDKASMSWVEAYPGQHMNPCEEVYHHDNVVRDLVEALTEAKKYHDADHGCNGFTCNYEVLRLQIDTALANISKEDGE